MRTTSGLVHERWRPVAQSAITAGVGVAVVLGVLTFHDGWTAYDAWMLHRLDAHIGARGAGQLFGVTQPAIAVSLMAFVVIGALVVRRVDVALLAVVGPVVGVVLVSDVLKPALDRPGPLVINGQLATGTVGSYPSGHQTGVTCAALVLFLVACQLPIGRRARIGVALVLGTWVGLASIALTRGVFHYSTDTIGAVGLSTAVVLGTALLLDHWLPDRLRGRPRPPVPEVRERARAAQLT